MNPKLNLFLQGFKATLPLIAGVLPFGVLYATIAHKAGFSPWLTVFTSIVVFGGSSQLVFIDLFQLLNSAFQAALGSNIVNARHFIYSAGVSPYFSNFKMKWKLILSYLLTDQLFAIAETHGKKIESQPQYLQPWFYFGSGSCTWISWVAATLFGIYFGHIVPESWNLAFSIPLLFLPLIFMTSKNKYAYFSCLFAIFFIFIFYKMPFGLGVLISILLSAFMGFQFQKFLKNGKKK